jgi:hypothetical protein
LPKRNRKYVSYAQHGSSFDIFLLQLSLDLRLIEEAGLFLSINGGVFFDDLGG